MDNNHKFEKNKTYFTISIYTIVVVFICAVLVKSVFMMKNTQEAFSWVVSILSPFLLGIFLAFLLSPVVTFFEENVFRGILKIKGKKMARILGILASYLLLLGFITFAFGVIIPQAVSSIMELAYRIPSWFNQLVEWLINFNAKFPEYDFSTINETIENWGKTFFSYNNIKSLATNLIPVLYSTSMSFINVVIDIVIALIVSVYLLLDVEWFARNTKRVMLAFIPEKTVTQIIKILKDCAKLFTQFVTGKMVDSFIIGVLCFLLMSILRLPFAMIISLVVGITNMIPYFGPYIGCIPGALIIVMISPLKTVVYLIMILVLQQFDGLVLGPKILGDSTGLRPVWIIFAVSVGGSIAGVIGMFLGVPVVAIIGYLVDLWVDYRLEKKKGKTS
jgi:predicted PurR-regulated permease PerM